MDQRVVVYGTSRHDLNGKHGVATDFHCYEDDRSRDRYSVLLSAGGSAPATALAATPTRTSSASTRSSWRR